jgi:hypothetical protein
MKCVLILATCWPTRNTVAGLETIGTFWQNSQKPIINNILFGQNFTTLSLTSHPVIIQVCFDNN